MARRWIFVWTWQKQKAVATKKEGLALAAEWKKRYEAKGWRVASASGVFPGHKAYAPDYDPSQYSHCGPEAKVHVCLVVELDERGKAIWPEFKPKPERKKVEKKPRRTTGRKPIGV